MSWFKEKIEKFAEVVSGHMFNMSLSPELTKDLIVTTEEEFKEEVIAELLKLIELAKDKDLPLHWLTKEIKAL